MVTFSRTLSPEQSEHVRELIRTQLQTRIPKQTQLAAALGVARSNFSFFMDGTRGATIGLALGVAFLLGCPIEDVLGMPRMPTFVDEQERRYPTRILAARAAYMEGVPVKRILQVLSSSLRYDGDPGVEWWVKLMRNKALATPGSREDTARAITRIGLGSGKATPRPRVKAQERK
ncbi:MAG: hypothetical protein ABI548_28835 [Polyangiaceae bacterium]|jgi:hypothetical protein